jgi:FAD/FMN-containing dehydrogenase
MKNVAGYDVSRALAGSLGTLGVIVELSLKVLPRPVAEQTLLYEMNEAAAIQRVNEWGGQPLPISATAWFGGQLYVRLSGAAAGVQAAHVKMGGAPVPESALLWAELREQSHPFFQSGRGTLWRSTSAPHWSSGAAASAGCGRADPPTRCGRGSPRRAATPRNFAAGIATRRSTRFRPRWRPYTGD